MYYLSSVPLLITLLFEKVFREKTFHKNYFSWKIIFIYFYHSCVPRWKFIQNLSKIWSFSKWFSVKKKKTDPEQDFFFCLRSSVRVLITVSFKKTFQKEIFHEIFFLWNKLFLQHSWVIPLIIFTKPFKIRFSWEKISTTKQNYSANCFSFFRIGTLYSHW